MPLSDRDFAAPARWSIAMAALRRGLEPRCKANAHALSIEVGGFVEPLRICEAGAIRIFLKKLPLHYIAIDLVGGPHHIAPIEKIIADSQPY